MAADLPLNLLDTPAPRPPSPPKLPTRRHGQSHTADSPDSAQRGGRGRGRAGRDRDFRASMTVVELQSQYPDEFQKADVKSLFGEAPAPPPSDTSPFGAPARRAPAPAPIELPSGPPVGFNTKRSGRRFEAAGAQLYDAAALQLLLEAEAKSQGVAMPKDPSPRSAPPPRPSSSSSSSSATSPRSVAPVELAPAPSPSRTSGGAKHFGTWSAGSSAAARFAATSSADSSPASSSSSSLTVAPAPTPEPVKNSSSPFSLPFFSSSSSSSSSSTSSSAQASEAEYERLLQMSQTTDVSSIEQYRIIYQSGVDKLGRPVVVVIAKHVPAKTINLDLLLLYVIRFLDPIVSNEYTLVFCTTESTGHNRPKFEWIQKIYSLFKRKYKKNVKAIYVVHPTAWLRSFRPLFYPFVSSKFWKKFHYINDPVELYQYIDRDQLHLPDLVLNYRPKQTPRFGVPLEEVLNLTHSKGLVPNIFLECVAALYPHMDKEGIFRMSGAAEHVKSIVHDFNSGTSVNLNLVQDPHVIAGVMKQFLRELPEPLIPIDIYPSIVATQSSLSAADDIEAWKRNVSLLMQTLPPSHYETLRVLCDLMRETHRNSAVNKMTFTNLSICFAPNILRSPEKDIRAAVADTPIINAFIERLFCHSEELLPPRPAKP